MDIIVFNRSSITKIDPKLSHIIISISHRVDSLPKIVKNDYCKGILKVIFWDTEERETSNSFTKEKARNILKFVEDNKEVDLVICQCDAGISRSAGTAAALFRIYNGDDGIFFKPPYYPNMLVYRTILNEYEKLI